MNQKSISKEALRRIRSWVYRFARHLDITRWQYVFEDGSKEAVMEALSFYQNEDGGFGNALELDCWNPNSMPMATAMAYEILNSIGCGTQDNPMVQGILRFVETSEYCTEHGWYWSVPSNNQYPSQSYYQFPNAPWFAEGWPPENYVNGCFIKMVLENFDRSSSIYQKHLRIIDYRISIMPRLKTFLSFAKSDIEQDIETNDWLTMINAIEDSHIKSRDDCSLLRADLLAILEEAANPSVFEGIRKKVNNKGIVSSDDLDAVVDDLCLNKPWCENGLLCEDPVKKSEEMASIGVLWWMIIYAIDKLKILKENNRIEV